MNVDNAKCKCCHELENISLFPILSKRRSILKVFFTWWNNLGNIQIPLHSESLEECILFGFQIEGDSLSVLNYCILIAKLHIYCNVNGIIITMQLIFFST